jgi:hypothetical protein
MIVHISFMFANNQQRGRHIIKNFRVKRFRRPLDETISKKCKFESSSSFKQKNIVVKYNVDHKRKLLPHFEKWESDIFLWSSSGDSCLSFDKEE